MGLFFADDSYDESRRMQGFGRYKQLLSFYAGRWVKVNLLTVLGALPLAAGIAAAILTSSILVLIPASLVGGAVFGPFLAALYDSLFRGLRDAPGSCGSTSAAAGSRTPKPASCPALWWGCWWGCTPSCSI